VRRTLFVVALIVLPIAAWKGFGEYERSLRSPFALWDFRAGMPFEEIDEQAGREQRARFTCNTILTDTRLCELKSTGIPGRMRVLVDPRGRASTIQFLPDSASPIMREESRTIAATWNQIRAGFTEEPEPSAPARTRTVWMSQDERWGAAIATGRYAGTPSIVAITDEASMGRIRASAPLAPLVLAINGLIDDDATDARLATTIRRLTFGQPVDISADHGTAPAPAAEPPVPFCEPATVDPVKRGESTREYFGEPMALLLERAVPTVYPGRRLVFGDGVWMVDSAGFSEAVRLGPYESDGADIFAFGVEFESRALVATDHLRAMNGIPGCRAPAEVLMVHRGPNRSMAGALRFAIDDEATVSAITQLQMVPPTLPGDRPGVVVRYTAAYATSEWMGSVDWSAIVSDDPPRATVRMPTGFAFESRKGAGSSGMLVVTGRSEGSIEISTLERNEWGVGSRVVTVPLEAGALRGAALLDHLLPPSP
jgi:hypothetical protein